MRSDNKRLVLGILGALAAVLALAALLSRGLDVTGAAAAVLYGWLIPLASIAVIAGVAWVLLSQIPQGLSGSNDYRSVACTSCSRMVLTDWRLCPYCGSALSPDSVTE